MSFAALCYNTLLWHFPLKKKMLHPRYPPNRKTPKNRYKFKLKGLKSQFQFVARDDEESEFQTPDLVNYGDVAFSVEMVIFARTCYFFRSLYFRCMCPRSSLPSALLQVISKRGLGFQIWGLGLGYRRALRLRSTCTRCRHTHTHI